MVSLGDNGAISMDATFGTNDVKFHLFTLMVFDAHHIGMPVAWIIYKPLNMWWFGGMVHFLKNKTFKEEP